MKLVNWKDAKTRPKQVGLTGNKPDRQQARQTGPSSGVYSLTLGEGPGLSGGPGRGPREGRGKV